MHVNIEYVDKEENCDDLQWFKKPKKIKCPNDFFCAGCGKKYHRIRPKQQAEEEHLLRIKNLPGYAEEIGDCDKTVEVCDHCYKKIMLNMGF